MVTLTFNEEKYKDDVNYVISEFQLFMKRFRSSRTEKVKYVKVIERGPQGTERLHIHMILILPDIIDIEKITKNVLGAWQNGFVKVDFINKDSQIMYVFKYINKKEDVNFTCSQGIGLDAVYCNDNIKGLPRYIYDKKKKIFGDVYRDEKKWLENKEKLIELYHTPIEERLVVYNQWLHNRIKK